jgi:hypothetical protein
VEPYSIAQIRCHGKVLTLGASSIIPSIDRECNFDTDALCSMVMSSGVVPTECGDLP